MVREPPRAPHGACCYRPRPWPIRRWATAWAGWEVEQVAAYTTVTADTSELPQGLTRTWAAGGVDAAVLTAPSTTRAVLELLGSPSPVTRLVAIGATTAAAAHELGLPVAATASSPTPEGVLRAVIDASQASTGSGSPSPEPP